MTSVSCLAGRAVTPGSRKDAAWAACAANQTHGLRRTNADKRKAVTLALKLHPEMSDQAIADHCGVSRNMAFGVRRQHVNGLQVEKRVGVDGKTRKVPASRAKSVAGQEVGPGASAELTAGLSDFCPLPPAIYSHLLIPLC